jgi:hypothetical protein
MSTGTKINKKALEKTLMAASAAAFKMALHYKKVTLVLLNYILS